MIHCDDAAGVLIHANNTDVLFTGDGRPCHHFYDYFSENTVLDDSME